MRLPRDLLPVAISKQPGPYGNLAANLGTCSVSKQQATVKAHSNTQAWSPPERFYRYGGNEPYTPPAVVPAEDRVCSAEDCIGAIHAKGMCSTHYRKSTRAGGLAAKDRRYRPFDPSKCGSKNGYNLHKYHGVEVCQPCRDAKNKYERQTYARRMGGGK